MIIDDHPFFSACLRALIEREIPRAECEWVASGGGLADRIRRYRPDLLVVDLVIGTMNGYGLAEDLRAQGISTPVLFTSSGPALPRRALQRLRSAAFISKAASPRRVVASIRRRLDAKSTVTPAVQGALPV